MFEVSVEKTPTEKVSDVMKIRRSIGFNLIKIKSLESKEKHPTVEMTWGETEHTQHEGNRQANKQSRCFALTSIDLLDACLYFIDDSCSDLLERTVC